MDIRYLEYFIEVVHSNLNLSAASKKLCVSQPVLSARIKHIEQDEKITLFERYDGRLQKLTPSGETFYRNAVLIVQQYQDMLHDLRESARTYKGKVKIGIPPLILGVGFSELLPKLILSNPEIEFEIIEQGGFELKKLLLSKSLDFAVLLASTDLSPAITNTFTLVNSELVLYCNRENPLAQHEQLRWDDLSAQPLAIFNENFLIYHHLMDKFRAEHVHPCICVQSSCWDFLLLSTKSNDIVTILPAQIGNLFNVPNIVERPFEDPIPWKVLLHQPKKSRYSPAEKLVTKAIVNHFK